MHENLVPSVDSLTGIGESQGLDINNQTDEAKVVVGALQAILMSHNALLPRQQLVDQAMADTGFNEPSVEATVQKLIDKNWIRNDETGISILTDGIWLLEDAFGSGYEYDEIDNYAIAEKILTVKRFYS